MTSLDARALTTDREGLEFLGAVLGGGGERPSLEDRFGMTSPEVFQPVRRRDPGPSAAKRRRSRSIRAAS